MPPAALPGALNPFAKGFKNPKTFYYGFAVIASKLCCLFDLEQVHFAADVATAFQKSFFGPRRAAGGNHFHKKAKHIN
jgi:hypothetical protein